MYEVWMVEEENGRYAPIHRIPQNHPTVHSAFLQAARMLKLMGAEHLQAKNIDLPNVTPKHCILVHDPTHNPCLVTPNGGHAAAIVVGAELVDEDGQRADASEIHTAHTWH